MSELNSAIVIATKKDSAAALVAGARSLAQTVSIVFAGPDNLADGADVGYRLPTDAVPFVETIPAIVELAKAETPGLILVEASADGRLVAGALGAAFGTDVLADVTEIGVKDGTVVGKRRIYGGAAIQTLAAKGVAIATASAGLWEVGEAAAAGEIRDLAVDPASGITFLGRSEKPATGEDLSHEKIVVGVGRGVGSVAGVAAVREFAASIGAGVGATRPAAEETTWYDGSRYLGISGDQIKPDVYIAAGVSGQVQHMVGVNEAGLIFAINSDANAPIFAECDYGIVGDVNQVIPALTPRFKAGG
jgi:electron transfer flavoprotein alpha subunit